MNKLDNIFFIPVGDLLNRRKDDFFITYSPLAKSMILMSGAEVENLKSEATSECLSPETAEELSQLTEYEPLESRKDQIRSCQDFVTLYVLPNYVCNLTCSYCFAAHGRDKQRLSVEHLKAMLDWMLNPDRTKERRIHVTFIGGGEPTLSFDTIRPAIEYANRRAAKLGFEIVWNIVTNGLIVDDVMLDFFMRQNVVVRYSFEIIKEIQENQRGNYDKVDASIKSACAKGMHPVIRSMITPMNVGRMPEMVEIVATEYPGVNLLKFDPVTDASYGEDLTAMSRFYATYNEKFLTAKKLGEKYGIDVQCVVLRNLDSVISRFCAGEISLNGYGEITACHRISSPRESGYSESRYGYVNETGVHIDEQRFQKITSDKVDTKTHCSECFLKYNCAGGCHAQNEEYTYDMQQIVCHYSRELSRRELLIRLDESIRNEYGKSIDAILNV